MIEVEAALAQAWAEVLAAPAGGRPGRSPSACDVERVDAAAVFAAAELGGNPVIPLVPMLKELAGPAAAELLHRGATSQDILDTAAMLVVRRCSDLVRDRLVAVRGVAADLARAHGATPDDRAHAAPARRADDVRRGGRPLARRARRRPDRDRTGRHRAAAPARRAGRRPGVVRAGSSAPSSRWSPPG